VCVVCVVCALWLFECVGAVSRECCVLWVVGVCVCVV